MPEATDTITDPVSGFSIPLSWIKSCPDPLALEKILSGRWTLLSSGLLIKRGLTTGTCAAAAKGAVISLVQPIESLEVMTPAGIRVHVSIMAEKRPALPARMEGTTSSMSLPAWKLEARAMPSSKDHACGGGRNRKNSRRGLCDLPGRPAITPSARNRIMMAILEGLRETGIEHARVEISIPRGREIAKETLNPRLGIRGGISILGTTGFVEPWNEHLISERSEELKGAKKVVITTGRTGLKFSRVLFPNHKAVLMGSQLDRLKFDSDQESILCGLPALILKWAWPQILEKTGYNTVAEMVEKEPGHENIVLGLKRAKEMLPHTRIVLLYKDGRILAEAP